MKTAALLASAAFAATPGLSVRPRGIVRVGAEADPAALVAELQRTFAAFQEANDRRLQALEKKKSEDVLDATKVDAINAEMDKLQAAIDEANQAIAALKIGGGGGENLSAEEKAYSNAFNRYFRKGDAGAGNSLQDLAVKAALSTDSDPDGGYTVPKEMAGVIDRILGTVSAMRGIATVISISTKSYEKLINMGGAASGWVGESEARPTTAGPTLRKLEFPVMEIYANPNATQSVLDDSAIDIGQWLGNEVATTFAEQEGAAFVTGNGVNKPRGILAYDTVANASYAWGKIGFVATGVAANIFDATHNGVDALLDLVYGLKQGYRTNARFIMNRSVQGAVRKLKTIGDTETYLWQPPVQAGQPATLLGYPITDDDNMNDIGANAFPIAFGDFRRGYLIIDRTGIRVLRDPYTNKPYVQFYTTKRVGGGVQNFEAFKLLKCASS